MMQQFKSSAKLKADARERLLGHYGTLIGAEVVLLGLSGSVSLAVSLLVDVTTAIGSVIYYAILFFISILMGLFTSGTCYLYLKLLCGRPISVGDLFYGFRLSPDKAITVQSWITLITYAASLPQFIMTYKISAVGYRAEKMIPLLLPYALSLILSGVVSVILSLLYSQTFYLLHDFPQYTARELLKKSRRLMVHHKGRLFYLYVSFLPLMLLGLFSFGLALLWVIPYMNATQTAFFLDLIRHNTEAAV